MTLNVSKKVFTALSIIMIVIVGDMNAGESNNDESLTTKETVPNTKHRLGEGLKKATKNLKEKVGKFFVQPRKAKVKEAKVNEAKVNEAKVNEVDTPAVKISTQVAGTTILVTAPVAQVVQIANNAIVEVTNAATAKPNPPDKYLNTEQLKVLMSEVAKNRQEANDILTDSGTDEEKLKRMKLLKTQSQAMLDLLKRTPSLEVREMGIHSELESALSTYIKTLEDIEAKVGGLIKKAQILDKEGALVKSFQGLNAEVQQVAKAAAKTV